MPQFWDTTAKNVGLDAIATLATRVALHTGDPGAANGAANEVSGGSPAYARKAIAFSAAAGGVINPSADVDLDVPASTAVTWASLWNTAGTVRYAKKQVTTETFGAQGVYRIKTTSAFDLNNDPA